MDNKHFCGRTRREFLWEAGAGFTGLALTGMLSGDGFFGDAAHAARQVWAEFHGDAKTHEVHDKSHQHQGHRQARRGHDDLARCDGDGSDGTGRTGYPHELHERDLESGRGSLILIDRWCQGLNTLMLRVFSRIENKNQVII